SLSCSGRSRASRWAASAWCRCQRFRSSSTVVLPARKGDEMPGKRGNSEGSISRRKDGLWEARITLQDGSRKSFYAKSRQDAARKLSEALRDRDKGLLVTGGGQSLGHYLLSWLEVTKPTIRPRTWRRYEQFVRIHVLPTLGQLPLTKLTAQHVQML